MELNGSPSQMNILKTGDDLITEGSQFGLFPGQPYVSKYHIKSLLTSRDSFGESTAIDWSPKRQQDYGMKRVKKYKEMLEASKVDQGILPNLKRSMYEKRFEKKTDNVISIIRSCEDLKLDYHEPMIDWRKQLDESIEEVNVEHHQLSSLTQAKRLYILRKEDRDLFKKLKPAPVPLIPPQEKKTRNKVDFKLFPV